MASATIRTKVSHQDLIRAPHKVVQELSLQVFVKRQEVLKNMIGASVSYKGGDDVEEGTLLSVSDDVCAVKLKTGATKRVDVSRLIAN